MEVDTSTSEKTLELRPVAGLTRGLSIADLEVLTVDAIRRHRRLLEKADQLFQDLPDDHKSGIAAGGAQHLIYIEACIEMHAQMTAVNTLVNILGYVPKASVN